MRKSISTLALAAVAAYAPVAEGQGWQPNQVNSTMCCWMQPRAGVVRDTVFIDGGNLYWLPGFADGTAGPSVEDENPLGLVYTLNFSRPFSTADNFSTILGSISKGAGGGAANNIAPNYYDGALLANNDEWFLYGGLLAPTGVSSLPAADEVLKYNEFQYGVEKPAFEPGFQNFQLPGNMTEYVAYGGAAAAPSENLAWYFSGMVSPSWGPISVPVGNDSSTAYNVTNTMITLNMTTQYSEVWTNVTLPPGIPGRANPELVWVPTGAQGILVALGGVVFPDFAEVDSISPSQAASESESPAFMSNIDIYDIAGNQWYSQPTQNGPGQLTRGCAVVAPAEDASSFNIYYYGGYPGLNVMDPFNDDVWVLSLPSFTWVHLYEGTPGHARAGHKCVTPYPDQMFVIGGYPPQTGDDGVLCLEDNSIIQLFNLSSGTWLPSYDPSVWSNYSVPSAVFEKIGGTGTGKATATTPSPSGWATSGLAEVFATPYPTSKITNFYPYASVGTASSTTLPTFTPTTSSSSSNDSGSGTPRYLGPVLGVVLGLVFVTMLVVAFLLWRRRKYFRKNMDRSVDGTEDSNGIRIMSWLRGHTNEVKAPTIVTTPEPPPTSPEMEQAVPATAAAAAAAASVAYEMPDTQTRVELGDTSRVAELQDTGLTPVDIINNYSHFATNRSNASYSLNNPSSYSGTTSQLDHASSISHSTDNNNNNNNNPRSMSPSQQQLLLHQQPQPQVGGGAPYPTPADQVTRHFSSGISGVSEIDRAHLRQVSDTTISSGMSSSEPPQGPGLGLSQPYINLPDGSSSRVLQSPAVMTPQVVSPPTASVSGTEGEGEDYVSVRQTTLSPLSPPTTTGASPLRRSVFSENPGDLGHGGNGGGSGA